MTKRETAWAILAAIAAVVLFLLIRDSSVRDALLVVLRRKSTEDLAAKIRAAAGTARNDISFTNARLAEEAERYRAQKLDESPAAIKAYYEKLFAR